MGQDEQAGYELVDHTSEVTLRLRASSFPGLIAEATRGFLSLVPDRVRGEVGTGWKTFELDEGDPAATLVAWINELVFHGEADLWLPCQVEVASMGASGVRIRCRVLELVAPFVHVKAATLHDAEIRKTEHGATVDVTLDI